MNATEQISPHEIIETSQLESIEYFIANHVLIYGAGTEFQTDNFSWNINISLIEAFRISPEYQKEPSQWCNTKGCRLPLFID